MNRRSFLSLIPLPFLAATVSANGDDEVDIPVEDCPCCCSDDGTLWYSCDESGAELPGDPAGCAYVPEPDLEHVTDGTDPATDTDMSGVNWETVTLPNTGSGPVGRCIVGVGGNDD